MTATDDIRPAREYAVCLQDESDGDIWQLFTIPAGTKADQDSAAHAEAAERLTDWVRGGDWGIEGARVDAWYTLEDDDDEWPRVDIVVDIEPDHGALMLAVGADPDCDHEWSSEDEGGCDDNPGVWATGGTSFTFRDHCVHCGLRRARHATGPQHNPGEHDTVEYELPEEE